MWELVNPIPIALVGMEIFQGTWQQCGTLGLQKNPKAKVSKIYLPKKDGSQSKDSISRKYFE
jgi:hypothetical protein